MWNYFTFCILIHLHGVHGNGDINLFLPDNAKAETSKFNSITNCIIAISAIELYFRPTVTILEQGTKESKENTFINKLIDKLMEYKIPQVLVKDILNEEKYDLNIYSLIVVFFNMCNDVSNFDFKRIDRAMRFLVVISDSSNYDCIEELEKIGELVSKYAVTFIIQDFQTDQNKIFTMFPKIDAYTCEEVIDQPTHINTCLNGTIENDEVFPIKNPGNLNKCPFRVGMADLFPFSTIQKNKTLKTYDHIEEIKGSDLEILKIVSEYFNATLYIHYINREEDSRYDDNSFLKYIQNGSLDACAGGQYRKYGDIVEYSGIYVKQDIFWIYHAERPDRSWENLIRKLDEVYIFFIFYITYSFIWCFISLFDGDAVSLIRTLLYGWGALVGTTSLQDARSKKQKFLNLIYLIMCIYLSAYINIQFYSYLTSRAPPRLLKTNSDVMKSGRIPFLKNSRKYFITEEKYAKFADTSKDCLSFYECAEKALQYNGVSLCLQGIFYSIQANTAVNDEARILRAAENMVTMYNDMIIRKNSSLVAKFQQVVQRLFEAGISARLFTKAVGISVVAKANSAYTNIITNSYSCQSGCTITLTQFAGVFYVWIIGCLISCFVFMIEIFMKRKRNH